MATGVPQAIANLRAAQEDPPKLALATLDIVPSPERPEVRKAFRAAAIPHWFTEPILTKLPEIDELRAARRLEKTDATPYGGIVLRSQRMERARKPISPRTAYLTSLSRTRRNLRRIPSSRRRTLHRRPAL